MSIQHQLAGFQDEKDGLLGRMVPAGQIRVPEKVWLKDDRILWRMGKHPRLREASRNTLDQFIRLTDPEAILRFARAWGVLALSGDQHVRPGRPLVKGVEAIA